MSEAQRRSALIVALVIALAVLLGRAAVQKYFRPSPNKVDADFASRLPPPKPNAVHFPPNTADKIRVLALLKSKEYAELTSLLESVQESFEKDGSTEYTAFDSFEAFDVEDLTIKPYLKEWENQFPNSFAPHLASAVHSWSLGWAARGTEVAGQTSGAQFESMEVCFDRAKKEAQAALLIRPRLLSAYTILITLANALGNHDAMKDAFAQAEKVLPESLIIRAIYMSRLTPRWGGSYDEMLEFAEQSSRFFDKNANLQILWGYVYFDLGRTMNEGDQVAKATEYTSKALSYGDYWFFLQERGNEYIGSRQYLKALDDMNLVLKLRPDLTESLVYRGATKWYLHRFDEAKEDFARVSLIDPATHFLPEWREHCVKTSVYEAGITMDKDPKLAMSYYDQAISLSPDRAESYFFRGTGNAYTGHPEEAKVDFQHACDLGLAKGCDKVRAPGKK